MLPAHAESTRKQSDWVNVEQIHPDTKPKLIRVCVVCVQILTVFHGDSSARSVSAEHILLQLQDQNATNFVVDWVIEEQIS